MAEPTAYIYAPGGDFLLPYIRREIAIADDGAAVMISSTDIYEPGQGWLDEEAPLNEASEWLALERQFADEAKSRGTKAYVLRCAPIVGTGMTGAVRRLAEEIYRGFFFHFPGNEARKSVVHATDVARAVKFLVEIDAPAGVYNLTDGVDPTLHDLAEAIAYRMTNKRISNLSTKPQQMIGKFIYGRERYRRYTTSELFSSSRIRALGFETVDTCEYMRTHVYDDSSL